MPLITRVSETRDESGGNRQGTPGCNEFFVRSTLEFQVRGGVTNFQFLERLGAMANFFTGQLAT